MVMNYICVQPASQYYAWQVEIMLDSFMRNGVNLSNVHILCSKVNGIIHESFYKLEKKYKRVHFFFYDDTRKNKQYISSIRPNILKQHFEANKQLSRRAIFYFDCDIILTKPINWEEFLNDDKWYGSDCYSYISYDYIKSKGDDIINKMCELINIDLDIVKQNDKNSIGAQYILKGVDSKFWENVENDSELLFTEITKINNQKTKENPNYHELQIWCADMWALLWNGWKLGKETLTHTDLEFSWATSTKEEFERYSIFHNAGVQHNMQNELFYKWNYIKKLPYNDNLNIKEETASFEYWKILKFNGTKSALV
jgi:hypothetical protein